jgi:tRNA threonylcarbamoyladenosine biosynthesis protein TsaB
VTPTLFAIDTAADHCSVALMRGADIASERGAPGHTHLEHALPMVQRFLERCGVRPADCDAFAFGSGPGSFTGLRVACTIVQGMAFATGRPIVAVGQLLALAYAGAQGKGRVAQRILAAIDARMGQAYWGVYEGIDEEMQQLAPPSLSAQEEIAALAGSWRADLCAGDAAWLAACALPAGVAVADARVDATHIVRLGMRELAAGRVRQAHEAQPEYVRDEVAQTVAQRALLRAGGRA